MINIEKLNKITKNLLTHYLEAVKSVLHFEKRIFFILL